MIVYHRLVARLIRVMLTLVPAGSGRGRLYRRGRQACGNGFFGTGNMDKCQALGLRGEFLLWKLACAR